MNTQYYTNVASELTAIADDLNRFTLYVQAATSVGNMSCPQLTSLSNTAGEKLSTASSQSSTLGSKVLSDISTLETNIGLAQAALAPLLVAPTDLPSVITWITAVINQYAGPNAAYTAQLGELAIQAGLMASAVADCTAVIASSTSSINNALAAAKAKKGCS